MPCQLVSREDSVRPMKITSSYRFCAASLLLSAAGVLRAQEPVGLDAPDTSGAGAVTLDFEFFRTKVQPIFLAKRPGHARCVACHAVNNSALRLQPLSEGSATWTEVQARLNFAAVLKVVKSGNAQSPLLVHPLAEAAGGDFFHGGGKHFNSQDDPEWQTLKAWVMGAKAP